MQLKIKIALASELTPVQIPPFDYGKIARVSLAALAVIVLCLYAALGISSTNSLEQEGSETASPVDDTTPSIAVVPDIIAPTPAVPAEVPIESVTSKIVVASPKVMSPIIAETAAIPALEIPIIERVIPSDTDLKISSKHIKRALLTSAIIKREPADNLGATVNITSHQKVYFYSHLLGLADQKVEHRWYYEQQLIATIPLTIGSHNWRTYSSKYLESMMLGQWRVEVVKLPSTIIAAHRFDVHH